MFETKSKTKQKEKKRNKWKTWNMKNEEIQKMKDHKY